MMRNTSTLISTLHMRKTKRIRHIVYNRFVPSPLRETQKGTSPWNSRPLGRVWGGPLLAAVFVPAKAGLFERPKAAFFTVAADGVMRCMTVGMVETTRRKTRFPTVGATIHAKAKPPSAATAFCIYVITLASAINNGENAKKKPHPTSFYLPALSIISLICWEK